MRVNWYTEFLLESILEKKKELAFFNALATKYEQAGEIAHTISLEIKYLIQKIIERKKQNVKTKIPR